MQAKYFRACRFKSKVLDGSIHVSHLLYYRRRAQQVVFPYWCKLRDSAHGPGEIPRVVAVPVVKPVLSDESLPAAGDFPIRGGEIGCIVERAEGVFARLRIPRPLVVQGVDGTPAGGIAGQTSTRAATAAIRRALFVDRPGAEIRPAPKFYPHPVEQVSDVTLPVAVHGRWVRAGENVIGGHGGRCLIDVLDVFRNVLEVAAPLIPGTVSGIQGVVENPLPSSVTGTPVTLGIA